MPIPRPAHIASGQIWRLAALKDYAADITPPFVLVLEGSSIQARVAPLSSDVEQAAADDFRIGCKESPMNVEQLVSLWAKTAVDAKFLETCFGTIHAELLRQVLSLDSLGKDAVYAGKIQKFRIGPDILLDHDRRIPWRASIQNLMALYHAQDKIRVFPFGRTVYAPVRPKELEVLAAQTAAPAGMSVASYQSRLLKEGLRVSVIEYGDGSLAVGACAAKGGLTAVFQDDAGHAVDTDIRQAGGIHIWRIRSKEACTAGFTGTFEIGGAGVSQQFMPISDTAAPESLEQFDALTREFEYAGGGVEEMLALIASTDDLILRHLLEEQFKETVCLDKSHPAWNAVWQMIQKSGTKSLKQWADDRNR